MQETEKLAEGTLALFFGFTHAIYLLIKYYLPLLFSSYFVSPIHDELFN